MGIFNTLPIGMQAGAVTGDDVYELYYAIYELMGYKIPDRFTTKPQVDPQVQQQMDQLQQQNQQLMEMVKFLQAEHDIKMEELKVKWAEVALKEKDIENKYEVDTANIVSDERIAAINAMNRGKQQSGKEQGG